MNVVWCVVVFDTDHFNVIRVFIEHGRKLITTLDKYATSGAEFDLQVSMPPQHHTTSHAVFDALRQFVRQ